MSAASNRLPPIIVAAREDAAHDNGCVLVVKALGFPVWTARFDLRRVSAQLHILIGCSEALATDTSMHLLYVGITII